MQRIRISIITTTATKHHNYWIWLMQRLGCQCNHNNRYSSHNRTMVCTTGLTKAWQHIKIISSSSSSSNNSCSNSSRDEYDSDRLKSCIFLITYLLSTSLLLFPPSFSLFFLPFYLKNWSDRHTFTSFEAWKTAVTTTTITTTRNISIKNIKMKETLLAPYFVFPGNYTTFFLRLTHYVCVFVFVCCCRRRYYFKSRSYVCKKGLCTIHKLVDDK